MPHEGWICPSPVQHGAGRGQSAVKDHKTCATCTDTPHILASHCFTTPLFCPPPKVAQSHTAMGLHGTRSTSPLSTHPISPPSPGKSTPTPKELHYLVPRAKHNQHRILSSVLLGSTSERRHGGPLSVPSPVLPTCKPHGVTMKPSNHRGAAPGPIFPSPSAKNPTGQQNKSTPSK